ncbi:MAG: hypothetical protein CMJ25_15875 [Phycisphaerae bacterium]|nr:hypothetical protein [Phycisphaerae bacterium]|tara:strand:+ start:362 stop:1027 length:666 start_codon:yes stop_codon:yes gene_type:complete
MEEEPEIQEWGTAPHAENKGVKGEIPLEEQLNTETSKPTKLNKNGKPRKQLSPEALERLAKAREKANAMRQQAYAKKLEEKVEKIKIKNDEVLPKKELKEEPQEQTTASLEHPLQEIVKEKPKSKPKGKKKTKIIVEQSSDDSDDFEPNDNVVFVKRVSRKKKELDKEPQLEMELPPPEPPEPPRPPPRPELTPQQRILKSQYEGMFGGSFMNNNLMRRHY